MHACLFHPSRALAGAAGLLMFAGGAAAQTVAAGTDMWTTPIGSSVDRHFDPVSGGIPLPAGFFGPGSDPFTGQIQLHGQPLDGTPSGGSSTTGLPGQADTLVRRLTSAPLSPTACPATAVVPIEIVALNLVSVQPITVTFNGGLNPTQYEVEACLPHDPLPTTGQMQITKLHPGGGRFTSILTVQPMLTFRQCTPGPGLLTASILASPLVLQGQGSWSYTGGGLAIMQSPGGVVDHDCDPITAPVPYPPTSNFFVGANHPGATCAIPNPMAIKDLTPEQEMLAAHGVLPACQPPGTGVCFGDGTGAACPCLNFGQPGNGCENSSATGGARLYAVGDAKVSADTVVLRCRQLPTGPPLVFFQGPALLGGGLGVVFGDGLRCVGGAGSVRLGIKVAVCGKSLYGGPAGDLPISVAGFLPAAGGLRFYQVWYRDAFAFCTPDTWNLSNGYSINWMP